jgi:hypothetical protein
MAMEGSIQEILGRLLARQERAEADAKSHQQMAEARQEKAEAEAKARHEEAEARQEKMNAEMKAAYAEMEAQAEVRHERFLARLDGWTSYGEGTTTWQTTQYSEELKATPEATEAAVEWQDLFKEEINLDSIGSSQDRCEDQRLAIRRRRGAKKRTRQKVSAARKRVIRRPVPAVRKGNIRKSPGKNNAAKGASRGKMLVKRQQNSCECENGRLGRDLKKRLSLRMRRTSGRNFKKPVQLKKKKRIFGAMNGLRKANKWTFWKVRPPPKRKKELRTA